jgi:hypothetical protein
MLPKPAAWGGGAKMQESTEEKYITLLKFYFAESVEQLWLMAERRRMKM